MIYTITLNPAIDCAIEMEKLVLGQTNYYQTSYSQVGGKGINVAIVLNNLTAPVKAIGLLGLENKDLFLSSFAEQKLANDFIFVNGATRTNYKLKNVGENEETEINGLGMHVPQNLIDELLTYLDNNLKTHDIVIGCGSLARGVPLDIYAQIGRIAQNKKALFLLDSSKEPLRHGLTAKPYLIKPNIAEICEVLNLPLPETTDLAQIIPMIRQLAELGATNVLLSMGKEGSYFFSQTGEISRVGIAKGTLVNSVGAGDSMLAGFAYGLFQNKDLPTILSYGAASGAATAFTKWLATKPEIDQYVPEIKVDKMKGFSWK